MHVRILGSAAGGGLPQWNCGCANCAAVRAGDPSIQARTQSSVAVSADEHHWFLLNVSPDIRQQILTFPALGPSPAQGRGTGIAGCVLTDAELDHTAGLLLLREGCTFGILSTALVQRWLTQHFPIAPILGHFAVRPWTTLDLEAEQDLLLPDGRCSGLRIRGWPLDGHVPRFVDIESIDDCEGALLRTAQSTHQMGARSASEGGLAPSLALRPPIADVALTAQPAITRRESEGRPSFTRRVSNVSPAHGSVVGLRIHDAKTGGTLVYAPCVGSLSPVLQAACNGADCLLLDGTFWSDDELIRLGVSQRTARQMGHVPVSGPDGTLSWLADLPARRRSYVHINNTNPMLNTLGPEHRCVLDRGVGVGNDGDTFVL